MAQLRKSQELGLESNVLIISPNWGLDQVPGNASGIRWMFLLLHQREWGVGEELETLLAG